MRVLTLIQNRNVPTLHVRQERDTAKPKATTRVIADTAAPANGGYIFRLAMTPHPSVAKAMPYKIRIAWLLKRIKLSVMKI